jgi:hypothetical protein
MPALIAVVVVLPCFFFLVMQAISLYVRKTQSSYIDDGSYGSQLAVDLRQHEWSPNRIGLELVSRLNYNLSRTSHSGWSLFTSDHNGILFISQQKFIKLVKLCFPHNYMRHSSN